MKRYSNLYYDICNLDNIRYIYDEKVKKTTKNRKKVVNFDNYYMENIYSIKEDLSNERYTPGKYNIFLVSEPKIRVVMSQNMYDKIINHLVSYFILKPSILPSLINSNVATREGMGTDYGIKLFKKYLVLERRKYDKFYVLKFDISKYFYNIDHEVLKKLLMEKIKDKKALNILFKIIDSTNNDYVNDNILKLINNYKKKIKDQNIIKEIDNIPLYIKGKGLPIGNMTSQILAIFYLNDLDHYIKEELKIKYYIRYMDDGILIHHDKEYLKYCLERINYICVNKYKLNLNRKTKIYNIKEGIDFLGFRYFFNGKKLIVRLRSQTKKNFKNKVRKYRYKNYDKYVHVLGSYKGHLKYANSKNLLYEVVDKLIKSYDFR